MGVGCRTAQLIEWPGKVGGMPNQRGRKRNGTILPILGRARLPGWRQPTLKGCQHATPRPTVLICCMLGCSRPAFWHPLLENWHPPGGVEAPDLPGLSAAANPGPASQGWPAYGRGWRSTALEQARHRPIRAGGPFTRCSLGCNAAPLLVTNCLGVIQIASAEGSTSHGPCPAAGRGARALLRFPAAGWPPGREPLDPQVP